MGKTSGVVKTRLNKRISQFDNNCKCKSHKIFTIQCPGNGRKYSTRSKELSKKVLAYLIEEGHLTAKSSFVCDGCVTYAKSQLQNSMHPNENVSEEQRNSDVEITPEQSEAMKLIQMVNSGELSTAEIQLLCQAIGNHLSKPIY